MYVVVGGGVRCGIVRARWQAGTYNIYYEDSDLEDDVPRDRIMTQSGYERRKQKREVSVRLRCVRACACVCVRTCDGRGALRVCAAGGALKLCGDVAFQKYLGMIPLGQTTTNKQTNEQTRCRCEALLYDCVVWPGLAWREVG